MGELALKFNCQENWAKWTWDDADRDPESIKPPSTGWTKPLSCKPLARILYDPETHPCFLPDVDDTTAWIKGISDALGGTSKEEHYAAIDESVKTALVPAICCAAAAASVGGMDKTETGTEGAQHPTVSPTLLDHHDQSMEVGQASDGENGAAATPKESPTPPTVIEDHPVEVKVEPPPAPPTEADKVAATEDEKGVPLQPSMPSCQENQAPRACEMEGIEATSTPSGDKGCANLHPQSVSTCHSASNPFQHQERHDHAMQDGLALKCSRDESQSHFLSSVICLFVPFI